MHGLLGWRILGSTYVGSLLKGRRDLSVETPIRWVLWSRNDLDTILEDVPPHLWQVRAVNNQTHS